MQKLFKLDNVTHMVSVELWVVLTTLLLVVRFLMYFWSWYLDRFTVATVHITEMLNYSMVHYTMGLMQLSAKRVNDYFKVWAVLLVTLQYSVKIGRPYSRSKQIPLLDLMSSFWSANLIRVHTFFPLWLIWSLDAARVISYFFNKAADINQENTRLVSDYMRYEHELGHSSTDSKEFSMQRYKYLVLGEDQVLKERRTASAQYRIRLDPDHKKLITVDKIWNVGAGSSGLLGNTADADNRLKDVCLSFALYKLLRRRFYDLPIHEAGQEKTRRLVFEYVLQDTNNYERAFRVTEVELSLLQDFFYSKHAAMFADGFPFRSMLLSLSLAAATGYIAYHPPERMDPADLNRITHGVLITRLIVALVVAKELLEIYMYVFSQWTKVWMICMHAKHQCLRHPLVVAAMRMMFCLITRGKWDQKIFQYNLLISSTGLKLTCLCFPFNIPFRHKSPKSIKLEPEVKKAIFESFKGLQMNPKRLESYFSNAFGLNTQQFERANELEADTHRILVWHIATCLCEIHLSDEATAPKIVWLQNRLLVNKSSAPEDVWPHYLTAASLSNYCAYLLTKALVPDKDLVANKVLNEVRSETYLATYSSRFQSLQDVYEKLMKKPDEESEEVAIGEPEEVPTGYGAAEEQHEEEPKGEDAIDEEELKGEDEIDRSIIQMGAKLGKQLIDTYATDRVGLWRDLAEFWTGFLLHLAASTRAAKHRRQLVGKGELITHLWALLSHAGFLGRTRHGQTPLDSDDDVDDDN